MSRRRRAGGSPRHHPGRPPSHDEPAAASVLQAADSGLAGSDMAVQPDRSPPPHGPCTGPPCAAERRSRDRVSEDAGRGTPARRSPQRGPSGPTDDTPEMIPLRRSPGPGEASAFSPPGELSPLPLSPPLMSPQVSPPLPSPQPLQGSSLGVWAQGPPSFPSTCHPPEVRPALGQYAYHPRAPAVSSKGSPSAGVSLGALEGPVQACPPSSPAGQPLRATSPLALAESPRAPASPHPSLGSPQLQLNVGTLGFDLQALLRQMPTKSDFETYLSRMESRMQRNFDAVHTQIDSVDKRVLSLEASSSDVLTRLTALESSRASLDQQAGTCPASCPAQLVSLQLQIEDLENRHRRNNLRIRGLPEATLPADLKPTVLGIFNSLLGRASSSPIELDRVHRTLGPRGGDPARPRDVICRVHFYSIKEEIARKAWLKGPFDYDGATLHILPDLSGKTLLRRRLLRPLLDCIKDAGATYKWGFPFHLVVRRADNIFALRSPKDLPELFRFLRVEPFPVPDWLNLDYSSPRSQSTRRPGPRGTASQSDPRAAAYSPPRRTPRQRRGPANRPPDPRAPEA